VSLSTKKREIEIFEQDYIVILTIMQHEKINSEAETFHYLVKILHDILEQNSQLREKVNQQIADYRQDFVR
jgi:hypothetical protein